MLMVDGEGRIVLVNSQTESLFGYPRDELLAMRVDDLIPERFRSGHHAFRRAFFERPDTRVMRAGQRYLQGRAADEAQGYLYGPGVPPERFAEAADAIAMMTP
jgi:PAS domain S-box-containing protein